MRPTIALVLTLMITGSLPAFDQFWILTRGGPDNSTTSLVMVIYREAFVCLDLGSAAGSPCCCWPSWSWSPSCSSVCCGGGRDDVPRQRRRSGDPVPVTAAVERLGVRAHRLRVNPDLGSDWRFSLVAVRPDFSVRYRPQFGPKQTAAFHLQPGETHLVLAVAATPSTHVNHAEGSTVDAFPYQLTIRGATPAAGNT